MTSAGELLPLHHASLSGSF